MLPASFMDCFTLKFLSCKYFFEKYYEIKKLDSTKMAKIVLLVILLAAGTHALPSALLRSLNCDEDCE